MTTIGGTVVTVQGNQVVGGTQYVNAQGQVINAQGQIIAQQPVVGTTGVVGQGQYVQGQQVIASSATPIVQPTVLPYMNYVYCRNPLVDIANCTGVVIKQEPELQEAVSGCETPNRYHVFAESLNGLIYMFKCVERSGCCMRHFCMSSLRAFNMEIRHIPSIMAYAQNAGSPFASAKKPFKCNCICCSRPEMNVTMSGDSQQIFGKIRMPWTACNPKFEVYDGNDELKYVVTASCCQCGICCAGTKCGKYSEANFDIFADKECKHKTGNIYRKVADAIELSTKADTYQVNFPDQATPQEKIALIGLGLMIDYQYFEDISDKPKETTATAGQPQQF